MTEGTSTINQKDTSPKWTRRKFLRVFGGGAAAAIITEPLLSLNCKPNTPSTQTEPEKRETPTFSPKVVVIDSAPSTPTDGIKQERFFSNQQMMEKVMGSTFIPEERLKQEFGDDYKNDWSKVVEKYPQALFEAFVDGYSSHGEKVIDAMKKVWKKDGHAVENVEVIPLQTIFDSASVSNALDTKGNEGINIYFDPKKFIELLKNDTNRVVNGSFQVGEVGFFKKVEKWKEEVGEAPSESILLDSEGNVYPKAVGMKTTESGAINYVDEKGEKIDPIPKDDYEKLQEQTGKIKEITRTSVYIEGAYAKKKALKNLTALFEVCNAYPDKFFVFAAGNENEDLREALETIGENRPKNVLITAQWSQGEFNSFNFDGPTHGVKGADIYVNNNALGLGDGSSFSTPVISAKAAELFEKGYTLDQIREKILAATDKKTIQTDEKEQEAKVFNPELLN